MVVAFAGLLGLAAADRVRRQGRCGNRGVVLVTGTGVLAVRVWAVSGLACPGWCCRPGGLVLMLLLARCKVIPGAWGIRLVIVVAVYALAKLLELGVIWCSTRLHRVGFRPQPGAHGYHAGSWPVISAMHNVPIQNLKK